MTTLGEIEARAGLDRPEPPPGPVSLGDVEQKVEAKRAGFRDAFVRGFIREAGGVKEAFGTAGDILVPGDEVEVAPGVVDPVAAIREKPFLERFTDPEFLGDFLGGTVAGSSPFLASVLAAGTAGTVAGGPGVGLASATAAGAITSGLQSLGGEYAAAIRENEDPDEAFERAWRAAGIAGVLDGLSVPLSAVRPFKGAVRNALAQLVAQPVLGGSEQAAQNKSAGRDVGEGVVDAMMGELLFEAPGTVAATRAAGAAAPLSAGPGAKAEIGPTRQVRLGDIERTIQTAPGEAVGQAPARPLAATGEDEAAALSPDPVEIPRQERAEGGALVVRDEADPAPIRPPEADPEPMDSLNRPGPAYRTAQGTRDLANFTLGRWSEPMIDTVEKQGGDVGVEVGRRARAATDKAMSLLGEWEKPLKRFLLDASGRRPKTARAVWGLNKYEWETVAPGVDAAETVFQRAVEDDAALGALSPEQRRMVEKFRKLVDVTGKSAEDVGVLIDVGGVKKPFEARVEGKRFARSASEEMWQILMAGPTDARFQALGKALAKMNGMEEAVALDQLSQMSERTLSRRAPLEVSRSFARFPAYLRVGGGSPIQLLHVSPFEAAQFGSRMLALRLGFSEQFGSTAKNGLPDDFGEALATAFNKAGGDIVELDRMTRALQGIPISAPLPRGVGPGTPAYQAIRVADGAMQLVKTGRLTRAFIPNLPEIISKVPAMGGARVAIGAMRDAFKLTLRGPDGKIDPFANIRLLTDEMADIGARTPDVLNYSLTPGRTIESGVRILRNVTLAPLKQVNEFNEFYAGLVGVRFGQKVREGRGTVTDRARLRLLDFDEATIERMMRGEATQYEYDNIARRFTAFTQGTTSLPAQQSAVAQSRLGRTLLAFDSYAKMTFNRLNRVLSAWGDSVAKVRADPKDNAAWSDVYANSAILGEFLGGHAAAGAMATAVTLAATQGLRGVLEEAEDVAEGDDLLGAASEWAAYALFSGQADALLRAVTREGGRSTPETMASAIFPVSVTLDFLDMATGRNVYRNVDGIDRASMYFSRNIAATRSAQRMYDSTAAMLGLGSKDMLLDTAISRYYEWRRDNTEMSRTEFYGTSKETRAFRAAMTKVATAIRDNRPPDEVFELVRGALGAAKGKKDPRGSIAASLNGKRLITKLGVQNGDRDRFTKEFDPELRAKIEAYDNALARWAKAIGG